MKQTIKEKGKNSEIMTIPNRYKDTLDNFINSSNSKFSDWPRSIDKRSYNILKFKNSLIGFLRENCLNKNVLTSNKSLWLALRTENSQLHQCHDIALFGSKNRKAQYKKGQKEEESG